MTPFNANPATPLEDDETRSAPRPLELAEEPRISDDEPPPKSTLGPVRRFWRRRPYTATAILLLALLLLAASWTMSHVDRQGRVFYDAGRTTVNTVGYLAGSLGRGDLGAVQSHYSVDFSGQALGLGSMETIYDRDGIQRLAFKPSSEAQNRITAVEEWRQYLASFASIDDSEMHVHRMEEWDNSGHVVASIRFEVIGTLIGHSRPLVDRAMIRFHLRPTPSGMLEIYDSSLIEGERTIGRQSHFVDVAPQAGIDFENRYYPSFLDQPLRFAMVRYAPAGMTAVDYDNDDLYDLFIPDGVDSRLFRNVGDGTFEDVTEAVGLQGLSGVSVAAFADYDNDGFKDVFVSRTFEANQLFHNNGDGTFTDVTESSGLGFDCCTTVASWADYDLDGDLDVYLGRYLDPRLEIPTTFYTRNGEPNRLYRNNGDGTFEDVSITSGVAEIGVCLGTVFGDYDDDGDPDLYVVNDFGRNTLYQNNGDGTFSDVTVATGSLAYGAGMNASMGDYDNDGRIDIYVTNIRSEHSWYAENDMVFRYITNSWREGVWRTDMPLYWEIFRQSGFEFSKVFRQMGSGNILLRNRGDGTFEDTTWEANANPPGWFWGASLADFDNDGWQDIYAANGWVYNNPGTEIELEFFEGVIGNQKRYKSGIFYDPKHFGTESWHGWERNRHLLNNGDGTFTEVATAAGTDLLLNSRGVAAADYWNRGVVDIAVAASKDRHALLKNTIGETRNFLAISLVGGAGALPEGTNRDAVGARVVLRNGKQVQMREVILGDGYGSQSSLRLHFGLGDLAAVEQLEVLWPRSGKVETFHNVAANQYYEVQEAGGGLRIKTPPREEGDPLR